MLIKLNTENETVETKSKREREIVPFFKCLLSPGVKRKDRSNLIYVLLNIVYCMSAFHRRISQKFAYFYDFMVFSFISVNSSFYQTIINRNIKET